MPPRGQKRKNERALEVEKLNRIARKIYRSSHPCLTREEGRLWMKYIRSGQVKYIPLTTGVFSMIREEYLLMMDILSRNAPSQTDAERRRMYDRLMKHLRGRRTWWTALEIVPPRTLGARTLRRKLSRGQLIAWRKILERRYTS